MCVRERQRSGKIHIEKKRKRFSISRSVLAGMGDLMSKERKEKKKKEGGGKERER